MGTWLGHNNLSSNTIRKAEKLVKNGGVVQIEDDQEITHQGVAPHIWVDQLSITGEE